MTELNLFIKLDNAGWRNEEDDGETLSLEAIGDALSEVRNCLLYTSPSPRD